MAESSPSGSAAEELWESIRYTPTWVVAVVCTVIVAISLLVEQALHYLGKFLKRHKHEALYEALQKLKEELMLLGFISLLMTVFQHVVSRVCVSENLSQNMLPCKKPEISSDQNEHHGNKSSLGSTWNRRRLLSESNSGFCTSKGKVPLLSVEALEQLHLFIFILAVVHVVFCASSMLLGQIKIRKWKHWEQSIRKRKLERQPDLEKDANIHPHHEFLKKHAVGRLNKSIVVGWTMSFFKQFYASVTKSDYQVLRSGFITRHCKTNPNFDFHKYIMRTLEDDFKVIVGIRWYLWLFVMIYLLLNVHGWHTYFWLSFLPLILLLIVGTKLEHIIGKLAEEALENYTCENPEDVNVKPSDRHFWFNHPAAFLYLIHFILFQNSFEIAVLVWKWSAYGINSCSLDSVPHLVPRILAAVIVQVLCCYSTFPLYAIVTQMGDSFKQAIFDDEFRSTLHVWAERVKKRKRLGTSSLLKPLKMFGSSKSNTQMQPMAAPSQGSSNDARPASLKDIVTSMAQQSETHGV